MNQPTHMKVFVFVLLLFLFPMKVYGNLDNVGVSCVSPKFPNQLDEENTLVLLTYFFKPNFEVHESWVLKDESGVKIEKFVTTSKYHEEINYIKWGRTRLDRKTLELTYRGFRGKIWKRDCSKFSTEEEMDNLLNKYYQKTKTIIKRMKKDNKI